MENKNSQIKIPTAWEHTPKIETRSELILQRRRKSIPHESFDLDGDGAVGAHDLFLATKFDLDKDGMLNDQERKNALHAIQNGFAKEFVWGCESSGLNRSFRIVQKRGKVIMDEDFGKIRDTYPVSITNGRTLTKSQLDEMRKDQFKEDSKKNEQKINTVTKLLLPIESFLSKDNYVSEPKYQSISVKKETERQNARIKAGLLQDTQDIKTGDVNFKYTSSPNNTSFSDMKVTRRGALVNNLNQSVDFKHKTFYDKIENEKQFIGASGRIFKDALLERKNQDVNHFEKTFGHRALGIHGRELPKFEENLKGFWRQEENYDVNEDYDNPFISRGKEYHKIEPKTEDITMKPTQVAHLDFESSDKNRINSRWTTFHGNFMPHGIRTQEIYEEHLKLIKTNAAEKKHFRFFSTSEITPPITQRLLQKNYSPLSKFKSITSTGFSNR